ncbi:MAG TPA: N-acyl homoserine lactonase family protein [Gemmatimonadaceae bacterium]|nr:N-acyl homoserine lactonase family protein [Gemmatimonadaceae bacterium]
MSRPRRPLAARLLAIVPLCIGAGILGAPVAAAQQAAAPATPPVVTLSRMECGTSAPPTDVGLRFSDVYAFQGFKVQLVYSCYLIRHGDDYMIWDAGFAQSNAPTSPKSTLVQLLSQLSVTPAQVKFVGISHSHGDHIGQASLFPQSTLLIGKGDWDVLSDAKLTPNQAPVAPWISGGSKVEPLTGDRDVFGDGSVVILGMPGHTPGHRSLLVRLPSMGPVLLTGDLAHFRENYESNGVPTFNTDRAATLASLDRFKKIATNLKATVIIQHDQRDVSKLPVFPAAAK